MAAINTYCDCMADIKSRLAIIERVVAGASPLGSEGLDGEIVCLMLRKVVEQIAFASLSAHKEVYAAEFPDGDYAWRSKQILERLAKVHPNFYPRPLKLSDQRPAGHKHFEDIKDGFLTVEELGFLYDKTSDALHTWNPFKTTPKVIDFAKSIAEWIQRIRTLLTLHWIQLLGNNEIWLIELGNDGDDVHAAIAGTVDGSDYVVAE